MNIFPLLYDNLISDPNFAYDLYSSETYNSVGMIMVFSSFIWMALYYFFLSDYSNNYKLYKWILWVFLLAIINFSVAYYIVDLEMEIQYPNGSPYSIADYINFSFINFIWSIIFCFILSIPLKKMKSTRASKTPF